MYQPIIIFISLRYICGHTISYFNRFASWLSIIGTILGVMALVTVFSVMNGFEQELQDNILKLIPQAILLSIDESLNPQKLASKTIRLRGVTHIAPLTISDVLLQSNNGMALGVMLGIDPTQEDPLAPYIVDTKQTYLIANKYNVILGENLAKQLGVRYGDQLRIIVPSISQFTLIGRLPSQRIFNVIGVFTTNNEVDDYQILVNIQDASNLMKYQIGNITGWRLWLKEPLKVDKLSQQKLPEKVKWKDWREIKGELFQAIHMEKNIIGLLLSLIIIVSAFNIMVSLSLMTMEKRAEIAILYTQGMTSCQIMMIFIMQGIFIGFIGAFFGSIFGILLASQINNLVHSINPLLDNVILPVTIKLSQIINIVSITIFVTLISTLYPSWRITRIQPIKVLRYE